MKNRVVEYFKSTKKELKHVSWPTRRQVFIYTAVVIGVSLFVALLLGFFDFGFSRFIKFLIS